MSFPCAPACQPIAVSNINLVRNSRDGDQFHYLWAARKCLQLVSPSTTLVAITVEGPSQDEMLGRIPLAAGEEVIDVGEYHGSVLLRDATSVRYVQLKHSTAHAEQEWTMSGLAGTLEGFAKRYEQLVLELGADAVAEKISFTFTTNRPISAKVRDAINDAIHQRAPRDRTASAGLAKYTNLKIDKLAAFAALFHLQPEEEGFLAQRRALEGDLRGYLPDADQESLLLLKDLITRKASSEFTGNPTITKLDVLRSFGKEPDDLFPAANKIECPAFIVARDQESSLVQLIAEAEGRAIVVHAEGGVGKSIFASRIGQFLPLGSVTVVYDCFGNGDYRSPSFPRHQPRQALVQIVNELAGGMHCQPLIPTNRADDTGFFRAFHHRVRQAISSIRQKHPQAILCITIDAADNAEMAAQDAGEGHSFARRLIREQLPEGVRLVMLCRTYRKSMLKAPASALNLHLHPFSCDETAQKLRGKFEAATDHDVAEFHRLTSRNPRVQATALGPATELRSMLRDLGPEPKTVDDMIGRLLALAIGHARDDMPEALQPKLNRICVALSLLRPMIPIQVLATLAEVDAATLRSFLADLGNAIVIKETLVQFRDEPTESWFQNQFRPNPQELAEFISLLSPQASSSAYVAAALPELMLKAGQLTELIDMALSSRSLPEPDTLNRSDIESQRLRFAIKASIKANRLADAAKLALKAGEVAAADSRQRETLQSNTDLGGQFLLPEQLLDVVARREFSESWRGGRHIYDAALLSTQPGFRGDAQSHVRMALEWLSNHASLPDEDRENERLQAEDIAELAIAHLNLYGAEKAAGIIARCVKAEFRFKVSHLVAKRLADANLPSVLDALSIAGTNDSALVMALLQQSARLNHALPFASVSQAWKVVRRLPRQGLSYYTEATEVESLNALALAIARSGSVPLGQIAGVLNRHLGTEHLRTLSYRHTRQRPTFVKTFVLTSTFANRSADLDELMCLIFPEREDKKTRGTDTGEMRDCEARVGALLPWYQLWADVALNRVESDSLPRRVVEADRASTNASKGMYRDTELIFSEAALAQTEVLIASGAAASPCLDAFRERLKERKLFRGTLIDIVWLLARSSHLAGLAVESSTVAITALEADRSHAEEVSITWIALSRALLPCHVGEAKQCFLRALDVASKIGQENLIRWDAYLHLAAAAADASASPELAYRVARAAELTYKYVERDKHFDWSETISVIADLCPTSGFAIVSRWRDRKFGDHRRLLPALVEHLIARRRLNGNLATALFGFQANWSSSDLLESVLTATESPTERQVLADFIYPYMRLQEHDDHAWRRIAEIATSFNVDIPQWQQVVAHALKQREVADQSKATATPLADASAVEKPIEWSAVFADIDVHTTAGLAIAKERCIKTQGRKGGDTGLIREAGLRVVLGREAEFLKALLDFPAFELYELRNLLERFPLAWSVQLSTKVALRELVIAMVTRHCLDISADRRYQMLPLDLAARVSGAMPADLMAAALTAIADTRYALDAEDLFRLVGLLAKQLGSADARETLDYGLSRLESRMDASDGDGPWSVALHPPTSMSAAVAGYVWASLAAPEVRYRWEAAHVVRGLCELGCNESVDQLMAWHSNEPPKQFTDQGLFHYVLHARQWLLMGIARVAVDHPTSLGRHFDLLKQIALEGEPHVLIRELAARAAVSIGSSLPGTEQEILFALRAVNKPVIALEGESRRKSWKMSQKFVGPRQQLQLHFGIDMPPYWFDPLASRFGMQGARLCIDIEKVILHRWRVSKAQWDDDQRHSRRLFDREDSYATHGSHPVAEDLHFYFTYHGLMAVAAELVDTVPMAPLDHDWDTFDYWMRGHLLTRKDGRWVADRRDPAPLESSDGVDQSSNQDWQWLVSYDAFEQVFRPSVNTFVVYGRWLLCAGPRREQMAVHSALVSPETAHALLRAMQTSGNPRGGMPLPRAGDERAETSEAGFELLGWVVSEDRDMAIDEHDPWAADVHFPPLRPADFVSEMLDLTADAEQRQWVKGGGGVALRSLTWNKPNARSRRDDTEVDHGRRLQASSEALLEMLNKTGKSMIFEVSITRRLSSNYYRPEDDTCVKYPDPYTRYFVLNKHGNLSIG